MNPPHSLPPLAVRMPKPLGDYVMASVALRSLEGWGFPLTVIGPRPINGLFSDLGAEFESIGEVRAALRRARGAGIGDLLLLSSSFRSAFQARLTRMRGIGVRGDSRALLLHSSMPRLLDEHKVEEYYKLGRLAAATVAPDLTLPMEPTPLPRISVPADAHHSAQQRVDEANVRSPYVVCCPTVAARHGAKKRWPAFGELYRQLSAAGHQIVTCPGPGEEETCREAGARGAILEGVPLEELAAILRNAAAVVSNDTGVVHLAAAVGAPTLGVYGDTDPARYGPRGPRADLLGREGHWPDVEPVFEWVRRHVTPG